MLDDGTAGEIFGSLGEIFGAEPASSSKLCYGELKLEIIEHSGAANALLASHVFDAAFALAERIECGLFDQFDTVLELGAASGLPSLLLAKRGKAVTATDFPSEEIVGVTKRNVETNRPYARDVEAIGHRWGDDPTPLLQRNPQGFDCVILSDLIWITSAHVDLVKDIAATLSRTGSAFVFTGRYLKQPGIDSFAAQLRDVGLDWTELDLGDDEWRGSTDIDGVAGDVKLAMLARRRAVRGFEVTHRMP